MLDSIMGGGGGGNIFGMVGGIVGGIFGGPLGAMIGKALGNMVGEAVGDALNQAADTLQKEDGMPGFLKDQIQQMVKEEVAKLKDDSVDCDCQQQVDDANKDWKEQFIDDLVKQILQDVRWVKTRRPAPPVKRVGRKGPAIRLQLSLRRPPGPTKKTTQAAGLADGCRPLPKPWVMPWATRLQSLLSCLKPWRKPRKSRPQEVQLVEKVVQGASLPIPQPRLRKERRLVSSTNSTHSFKRHRRSTAFSAMRSAPRSKPLARLS